ncbi:MAG TPA: GspH/FimT family pseudopilin [Xanthomonadales bacterium]|nr:GspH/FimT family pseudopilin [Xanthomonadales bacterium]
MPKPGRTMNGFTMIELMITIAILAVLAAIAAPSFNDFVERARLRSSVEEVLSFLATARQEAVKRDRDVTVAVGGSETAWCLGAVAAQDPANEGDPVATLPAACDCSGAPAACTIGGERRTIDVASGSGVTLVADNSITFSSKFGGLADLSAVGDPLVLKSKSSKYEISVVVTPLGHARSCVADGKTAVTGVPTCP